MTRLIRLLQKKMAVPEGPPTTYTKCYSLSQEAFPILNILVLQTGQIPCVAGLPFFIVTACGSFISRFALHFTQYASTKIHLPLKNWGENQSPTCAIFHIHYKISFIKSIKNKISLKKTFIRQILVTKAVLSLKYRLSELISLIALLASLFY